MYRDVVHRRWARAFLFHLLSIGPFLFLWAAPLVVRAGLLPSLLSFFSLRLYLAFAIFDISQLLFVLARHAIVVADAPPLPSTASLLASAANLAGFSGTSDPRPLVHQDQQIRAVLGGFRGPASQWEAEAARATLAGRAKFAALCAAAGAAGAIALSLFRAQLMGGAAEIESNSAWWPDGWAVAGEAGFGVAVGVLFAAYHVVRRDYLLAFPVLQVRRAAGFHPAHPCICWPRCSGHAGGTDPLGPGRVPPCAPPPAHAPPFPCHSPRTCRAARQGHKGTRAVETCRCSAALHDSRLQAPLSPQPSILKPNFPPEISPPPPVALSVPSCHTPYPPQRAPFYRFKTTLPRCATSAATFGCLTALLYSLLLRPLLLPLLATATTAATGIPLPFLAPPPLSIRALLLALLARLHAVALLAFSWEAAAAATDIFLTHRHLFLPPPHSPSSPIAPLLLALSPSPSPAPPPSPPPLPLLALPAPPALPRLVLHWALLDLSLLAESEADTWRRAALFESQEAYSAVVAACMLPLDAMTARVAAAAGYPTVTGALQHQQQQQQQQQQYSLQSPSAAVTAAGFASAEGLRWRQGKGGGEGVEGQALQGGGVGGSGTYGGFGGQAWNGGVRSDLGAAAGEGGGGLGVGGTEQRRGAGGAGERAAGERAAGERAAGGRAGQVRGRQVGGRQVGGRQVGGRQVAGGVVAGGVVAGGVVAGGVVAGGVVAGGVVAGGVVAGGVVAGGVVAGGVVAGGVVAGGVVAGGVVAGGVVAGGVVAGGVVAGGVVAGGVVAGGVASHAWVSAGGAKRLLIPPTVTAAAPPPFLSHMPDPCTPDSPIPIPRLPHPSIYTPRVFPPHQLCAMSMRALAALTAASRTEDRMGVAQMAGANAAALSSLLSNLLSLDHLLLSPSHRHPAAPATFSGFGEASSQAPPPGASQPAFSHQTSALASGSGGLFGTPTLGLRYGGTEAGGSAVPGVGAGGGVVGRAVYGEGVVGPVWGEAWAMADVVRTALYRIAETFGEEMVEKGGGAMGGGRGGRGGSGAGSWRVDEAWLPLFGSREAHAAKVLSLLAHTE
ncbi:unnamed protein product [Closterium sp. Naga37s-1]|nr:unnamed protein product [Closterium sp. Naga37s-1]